MIDALIDDGDVVVITPTNTAQNGEMVVAWLKEEEEATLKKFYREGSRVRLQPANSTMDPIYADADNVGGTGARRGSAAPVLGRVLKSAFRHSRAGGDPESSCSKHVLGHKDAWIPAPYQVRGDVLSQGMRGTCGNDG